MINISHDLSNKLPTEHVNIIRQVAHAAEGEDLRLFIVGAQARDLLLQYVHALPVHRATNDIDFGVLVEDWDEFTKLKDRLIATEKFRSHKVMQQRLVHESELLMDLVPFGNLEEPPGQIAWPPDFSIVMSTVGFKEAYDNSVQVRIADDVVVKVASMAGLGLLKMVAWDDRRYERDAQDLGLIMRRYLDAGNGDRVYSDEGDCGDLLNDEFDYDKASAHILGRDIGRLLTENSRRIIERALSNEGHGRDADLASAMIRNNANYNGNLDIALEMLAEVRVGVSEWSDR
jgi:predicted nucleotidyltransferase